MPGSIVSDIYNDFEAALTGFYSTASAGLTGYVIPIAWVLLGIAMLIWCYMVIEGKITQPITDWFLKYVGFMVVLYVMGNGYLTLIASPLFNLNTELVTAMSSRATNAPDLLGQVNDKTVDLLSAMVSAAVQLIKNLAFGPAIAVLLLALLVAVAVYLLLGIALFAIIFGKLGLSMVLAVGPFFILMLILPQLRHYFNSWLNTALYFVLYQVMSALFVFLFIGVLQGYTDRLIAKLSGGMSNSIEGMVLNLMGAGPGLGNTLAMIVPLVMIAIAMFFMFLQLGTIVGSLTSGSGGMFGGGLTSIVHMVRSGGKGR